MSRPIASSDVFRAVADPTRRRLLDMLRQREHTFGELCEPFHLHLATLSRHLAVLRQAGLVTQRRQGRNRVYSIHPGSLVLVLDWITRYRPLLKS